MSRISDERGTLMDLGQQDRPQVAAEARNLSPIVPRASIAGRALVAVVAIMTFLASITTGAVLLVSASAAEWQSEVASEITVQVRPVAGRDLDRDSAAVAEAVRTQMGIVGVQAYTKEESAKLLEPWLGAGLSLDDLPVPRVIIARVSPGTPLDLAQLRGRVTQVTPARPCSRVSEFWRWSPLPPSFRYRLRPAARWPPIARLSKCCISSGPAIAT
jgi:cell division transport system permease protein